MCEDGGGGQDATKAYIEGVCVCVCVYSWPFLQYNTGKVLVRHLQKDSRNC